MEQQFKCRTVRQRKIMEWLAAQGVTRQDIAEARLIGTAMVNITNPAGQDMDLYCDAAGNVRILDVSAERQAELDHLWCEETEEPETAEWREELNADEAAMVEQWEEQYAIGISELIRKMPDTPK